MRAFTGTGDDDRPSFESELRFNMSECSVGEATMEIVRMLSENGVLLGEGDSGKV
jgi:hypothetical protein